MLAPGDRGYLIFVFVSCCCLAPFVHRLKDSSWWLEMSWYALFVHGVVVGDVLFVHDAVVGDVLFVHDVVVGDVLVRSVCSSCGG